MTDWMIILLPPLLIMVIIGFILDYLDKRKLRKQEKEVLQNV